MRDKWEKSVSYLTSGIGLVDFGFPRQSDVTGLVESLGVAVFVGTLPSIGRVIAGAGERLGKTSGA